MIVFVVFISPMVAQEDIQIGSLKLDQRQLTGFFDFSDPAGINIKVQVWGYVKFPGYYVIPARSSINELISLAGGPTDDAVLDDVRIIRANPDSSLTLYRYNFNDLLWNDVIETPIKFTRMYAGDMLIIRGEPRYTFRENVGFTMSIISALASISILVLNVLK